MKVAISAGNNPMLTMELWIEGEIKTHTHKTQRFREQNTQSLINRPQCTVSTTRIEKQSYCSLPTHTFNTHFNTSLSNLNNCKLYMNQIIGVFYFKGKDRTTTRCLLLRMLHYNRIDKLSSASLLYASFQIHENYPTLPPYGLIYVLQQSATKAQQDA